LFGKERANGKHFEILEGKWGSIGKFWNLPAGRQVGKLGNLFNVEYSSLFRNTRTSSKLMNVPPKRDFPFPKFQNSAI
jgi:hypothetical protein